MYVCSWYSVIDGTGSDRIRVPTMISEAHITLTYTVSFGRRSLLSLNHVSLHKRMIVLCTYQVVNIDLDLFLCFSVSAFASSRRTPSYRAFLIAFPRFPLHMYRC